MDIRALSTSVACLQEDQTSITRPTVLDMAKSCCFSPMRAKFLVVTMVRNPIWLVGCHFCSRWPCATIPVHPKRAAQHDLCCSTEKKIFDPAANQLHEMHKNPIYANGLGLGHAGIRSSSGALCLVIGQMYARTSAKLANCPSWASNPVLILPEVASMTHNSEAVGCWQGWGVWPNVRRL